LIQGEPLKYQNCDLEVEPNSVDMRKFVLTVEEAGAAVVVAVELEVVGLGASLLAFSYFFSVVAERADSPLGYLDKILLGILHILLNRYIKSQKSQMIFTFLLKGMHQTLDT
jgi:hypothetical protein